MNENPPPKNFDQLFDMLPKNNNDLKNDLINLKNSFSASLDTYNMKFNNEVIMDYDTENDSVINPIIRFINPIICNGPNPNPLSMINGAFIADIAISYKDINKKFT